MAHRPRLGITSKARPAIVLLLASLVVVVASYAVLRSIAASNFGSGDTGQSAGAASPSSTPGLSVPTPGAATPTVTPTAAGYVVVIAPGLQPKWSAEAAAAATMHALLSKQQSAGRAVAEAKIISVQAMPGGDVPQEAGGPFPDQSVAWVVSAQGTFFAVNPRAASPLFGSSGWYVFDDTGDAIGYGFTPDAAPTVPAS